MHPRVVEEQSGLPVGYDVRSGELVQFEEARGDLSRLRAQASLSEAERESLALGRLEASRDWPERIVLPDGRVDRERALREIRGGTDLGQYLVEVEMNAVKIVRELLDEEVGHG